MSTGFVILTILFSIVSAVMILIILVQRPQGGGLAGAFGGASGGGTDTVFGGRVGDALTVMTVGAFAAYLAMAIGLNMMDPKPTPPAPLASTAQTQPAVPPATRPATRPATHPAATMPVVQLPAVTAPASAPDSAPLTPPAAAPESAPATAPDAGTGGE